MTVPGKRGSRCVLALALTLSAIDFPARADEIRLKDGKKLYGVIVAYEDNMFKVKTDFGYVLVEKDKIASIIPSEPGNETPKPEPAPAKKQPALDTQPKTEPAVASSKDASTPSTNANAKSVDPSSAAKSPKPTPKITNTAVKPELPANSDNAKTTAVAPAIKESTTAPTTPLATPNSQPAAPKEPEPPAIREEIQGTVYTNYTHGFRMYKAPSWELIEDARKALPNAFVALGTSSQSTLLIVGQENTKEPLDPAASAVERRLREIYVNYRRISMTKTTVGGSPAVEYHYRGTADDHDWSGTLVVIAHGTDIFTVLGMTYADNDLIQIQENVIARTIASLDFNVH
jgi:hypothetical protein